MRRVLGSFAIVLTFVSADARALAAGPEGGAAPEIAPAHADASLGAPARGDAGLGGPMHADASLAETPAQRAYRHEYMEQTLRKESEITHHRVWTPEMRKASFAHWRRAYKALRIRELAQDDGETSAVQRVDSYLAKLNEHFFALLTELSAKAPEIPPAPTLLSPAAGAQLAVGTAITFKMAPYKDAKYYYCSLWEPGGHGWSNWTASSQAFGTAPDCTIAADDPRWLRFRSGKAEFHGRALLEAKSDAGDEYKVWSDPVKVELTVAGAAGAGSAPDGLSARPLSQESAKTAGDAGSPKGTGSAGGNR